MLKYLNEFQEKALSIYMEKYGIDKGLIAMDLFENKNMSFGRALIEALKTGNNIQTTLQE